MEGVDGLKMLQNYITLRGARERLGHDALDQQTVDVAEDPRCALRSASEHHPCSTRGIKYIPRFPG